MIKLLDSLLALVDSTHRVMTLFSVICLFLVLGSPLQVLAAPSSLDFLDSNEADFLPVDEAFILTVAMGIEHSLQLEWLNRPGYYLYRHSFSITTDDRATIDEIFIPKGKAKKDEFFGDVEVYYGLVQIPLDLTAIEPEFMLTVVYQGCADAGLCYPPEKKQFLINSVDDWIEPQLATRPGLARADVLLQEAAESTRVESQTEEGYLAQVIRERNLVVTLALFLLAGIGLAFTPCVLPMVPILSSIIVGQKEVPTRSKAFMLSLVYVAGMALTYALLGTLVGYFGAGLNIQAQLQSPWVLGIFAMFFVLLSMSMFGFYELQLPSALQNRLNNLSQRQAGGKYLGVAIMGVLSSLVVSPCVSAPLAGALIYISSTGDALLGGLILLALGIGMGLPLIVVGSSGSHLLPRAGQWMQSVKAVFGVLLLAVAIWMLERVIPAQVTLVLWAALVMISGIYMGALEPAEGGWSKLWKGSGLVMIVYGVLLMIGASMGAENPLQPLERFHSGSRAEQSSELRFQTVEDLDELRQILATTDKPVFLDFYADWCVSCKIMERSVFPVPDVSKLMSQFLLVQADVTANDQGDQSLLQGFGLFGPPSMLFFGPGDDEIENSRIQGEMNATEFAAHLRQVLAVVE